MIFGNRIRELREQEGLLLRELAAILAVDTATVSKIERGDRQAKKAHLLILANTLKVDLKELETLWLADKLYGIIEDEECGLSALKVAENEVKSKIKLNDYFCESELPPI